MTYLKLLRMNRGLTQRRLAKLLGLHPTVMSRIEQGWFAKPPAGLDQTLRAFFGPAWTFAELMREVPAPAIETPECDECRAESVPA